MLYTYIYIYIERERESVLLRGEERDMVVEEEGKVVGHQILARHTQIQGIEVAAR
jgi:hypothetical protein